MDDLRVGAPRQHPALDFRQRAESQAQFEPAVGQIAQFLGLVPLALAHAIRDPDTETDHEPVVPIPAQHAERVREKLLG